MSELKPCPFCGVALERRERKKQGGKAIEVVFVHPENGCIILKWKIETDGDIALWNRRVT